ncbi:MAG: hypothetical protein HYW48_10235 [Deltaproteobacteria bacterium]|nr:hypothetical protein [Deltaproteobacteria bacterium]
MLRHVLFFVFFLEGTGVFGITHESNYCARNGSGNSPVLGFMQCLLWCENDNEFEKTRNAGREEYSHWLWEPSSLSEFNRKKCDGLPDSWTSGWARSRCQAYWNTRYSTTWYMGAFRCWNFEHDRSLNELAEKTSAEKIELYKSLIEEGEVFDDPSINPSLEEYKKVRGEVNSLEAARDKARRTWDAFQDIHNAFLVTIQLRLNEFDRLHADFLSNLNDLSVRIEDTKTYLARFVSTLSDPEKVKHATIQSLKDDYAVRTRSVHKLCHDSLSRQLEQLRSHFSFTSEYASRHNDVQNGLELPPEYSELRTTLGLQMSQILEAIDARNSIFSIPMDSAKMKAAVCNAWGKMGHTITVGNSVAEINERLSQLNEFRVDLDTSIRIEDRNWLVTKKMGELREFVRVLRSRLTYLYLNGKLTELLSAQQSSLSLFQAKKKALFIEGELTQQELEEQTQIGHALQQEVKRIQEKTTSWKIASKVRARAQNLWVRLRRLFENSEGGHQKLFFEQVVLIPISESLGLFVNTIYPGPEFANEQEVVVFEKKLSEAEAMLVSFEQEKIP